MKIKKGSLLGVVFFLGIQWAMGQSVKYNHDFAPQEGLIKHVEKPVRDEICLNGQ